MEFDVEPVLIEIIGQSESSVITLAIVLPEGPSTVQAERIFVSSARSLPSSSLLLFVLSHAVKQRTVTRSIKFMNKPLRKRALYDSV